MGLRQMQEDNFLHALDTSRKSGYRIFDARRDVFLAMLAASPLIYIYGL